MEFSAIPSSLEVSPDGSVITTTHGSYVSFWKADRLAKKSIVTYWCLHTLLSPRSLEKVKEVKVPTQVNSASLSPDKSMFVCGGEDLKVYKFDYDSGNEIGQ